ncbi:uncharacterized protein [Palaemon carinicauda]|uniref:uncharacterized protein n=1 Tax=Palaemon carinicauda TaxID=392227 RepID=UPI0035B5EEB8
MFSPLTSFLVSSGYRAQKKEETVASWACRLEELMSKIVLRDPSRMSEEHVSKMLHKKFWSGLQSLLITMSLRYQMDIGVSFENMLVSAWVIELEGSSSSKSIQFQQVSPPISKPQKKDFADVMKRMDALQTQVEALQKSLESGRGRVSATAWFGGPLPEDLLQVKIADGTILKYLGCIEVSLRFPDLDLSLDTLMLVVPNTEYHRQVAFLVGKNILSSATEDWIDNVVSVEPKTKDKSSMTSVDPPVANASDSSDDSDASQSGI